MKNYKTISFSIPINFNKICKNFKNNNFCICTKRVSLPENFFNAEIYTSWELGFIHHVITCQYVKFSITKRIRKLFHKLEEVLCLWDNFRALDDELNFCWSGWHERHLRIGVCLIRKSSIEQELISCEGC